MKPANGSQSDEIGAACVRGRRPHSLLLREIAERRSTDVPDYGVSGTTRRYTLIVGMLVALATVPTLVVMAVGAAPGDSPAPGGTPRLAAPPPGPGVGGTPDPPPPPPPGRRPRPPPRAPPPPPTRRPPRGRAPPRARGGGSSPPCPRPSRPTRPSESGTNLPVWLWRTRSASTVPTPTRW